MSVPDSIIHDLDVLCVGPPSSGVCAIILYTLQYIVGRFIVPLAAENGGPDEGYYLNLFGMVIFSGDTECRLPATKLEAL